MKQALDVNYTNGVIAVKEKKLLNEKIFRLCECSAEEAFRVLLDSGYGGGAETATSVYDFEKLIEVEEKNLDAFVHEYAPSETLRVFLLSPRDFHNAKAIIKAVYLGVDVKKMLAPQGDFSIEWLLERIENGEYDQIKEKNSFLGEACSSATELLQDDPSGAKLGAIFEEKLYLYLWSICKRNRLLRDLLIKKADMTNILIAFRCKDENEAKGKYLPIGKLSCSQLKNLFSEDVEKVQGAFQQTPYAEFVKLCIDAKRQGLPMMEAEKIRDGYEAVYFSERKYELKKTEPFLYYVYRRRMENTNVRIVFVCLLAGQKEQDVKKRLRAW